MSVPAWERDKSKTDFIRLLMELNIRMGKIVGNKPKKYKQNYGDHLVKTCLEALKHAEIANSVYIAESTPQSDLELRKRYFEIARGEVKHIGTAALIFLEICKESKEEKVSRIMKEEEYIGSMCADISKSISGVVKSDKKYWKKA